MKLYEFGLVIAADNEPQVRRYLKEQNLVSVFDSHLDTRPLPETGDPDDWADVVLNEKN